MNVTDNDQRKTFKKDINYVNKILLTTNIPESVMMVIYYKRNHKFYILVEKDMTALLYPFQKDHAKVEIQNIVYKSVDIYNHVENILDTLFEKSIKEYDIGFWRESFCNSILIVEVLINNDSQIRLKHTLSFKPFPNLDIIFQNTLLKLYKSFKIHKKMQATQIKNNIESIISTL